MCEHTCTYTKAETRGGHHTSHKQIYQAGETKGGPRTGSHSALLGSLPQAA